MAARDLMEGVSGGGESPSSRPAKDSQLQIDPVVLTTSRQKIENAYQNPKSPNAARLGNAPDVMPWESTILREIVPAVQAQHCARKEILANSSPPKHLHQCRRISDCFSFGQPEGMEYAKAAIRALKGAKYHCQVSDKYFGLNLHLSDMALQVAKKQVLEIY
ncbi:hypothetical protein K469DRAFT_697285 [Zopfia rhizophila CBS 207.26]|uniref:Uncharacterized protein n=1 Tax=Zopfia rhizophila CBS 207.26 TaxID=1314779 RepID=A0A6A6DEG2_9PEZI|nr:hypothetical protein K469DRAFT_697285 [Zopfia rhizophila CBS 207.26]